MHVNEKNWNEEGRSSKILLCRSATEPGVSSMNKLLFIHLYEELKKYNHTETCKKSVLFILGR